MAKLPIRPFSLKKAAQLWGTTEAKAEKLLDRLCEKGLLVDSYDRGVRKFVLPPPMIGFFEFSLMRTRGDIDQKYLSELFYQYINVEEDFIKDLFLGMDTKLGRVFVNESVLMTEKTNHILDYERATHIIEEADFIGVGTCFCRHKNYHLGIPCKLNAPQAGPGQQTVQVRLPGPPPGCPEKGKALRFCHEKKAGDRDTLPASCPVL